MARNQNKLLTGIIIAIHSEKEVSVVKITGNIKENIQKLPEVVPLDSIPLNKRSSRVIKYYFGW